MSIQRAGFSLLPPPVPVKFLYFSPTLFPIQESCVMTPDSRLGFFLLFVFFFCFYKCCLSEQKADVPLLQQISKKRHSFPEAHVFFRSNLDSGLKKNCMYIFYLAFYKRGMFGVKTCVHQDQPQLYSLLCSVNKA